MSGDYFDGLRTRAEIEGDRQDAFQERVVKRILKHVNIPVQYGYMKAQAAQDSGSRNLDLAWFQTTYSFPVRLFAQKIPFTHKATLADIYGKGRFKKLPWWKEYESQASMHDVDLKIERAALFFNLPGAREAFLMVIHNQPIQCDDPIVDAELRDDEPWPRTTFPLGKSGIVGVLESFQSFMQTVGTGWTEK